MKKPRAEGKGCDRHSQECRHDQQGPEHGLATSVVMQSLSLVSAFVSLSFLCHLGTKTDTKAMDSQLQELAATVKQRGSVPTPRWGAAHEQQASWPG